MSLLMSFSRVTLAGVVTRSSAAKNRFTLSTHLHRLSNGGIQLRNLTICSNGCQLNEKWRNRSNSEEQRHFPVLQQHLTVRTFFSGSSKGSQPEQKKDSTEDERKSTSPVQASEEPAKLGLFARFKKMYKEYWYVLVPVHCVTSVLWLGGFYYISKSGVDVIALLESMGVSEKLIDPVRDSSLGHIAVAYLLYKIATPARYTVTLGGTTLSIKYLVQWGYIKPMPSKAQLVQMYKDKKENFQDRIAEKKQDFEDRKQALAEKKKNLQDELQSTMKSVKPKKNMTGGEK